MVGWHHRLSEPEFEQTLEDSEGQGSLVYCRPRGRRGSDTIEQLNNNNLVTFTFSHQSDFCMTLLPQHTGETPFLISTQEEDSSFWVMKTSNSQSERGRTRPLEQFLLEVKKSLLRLLISPVSESVLSFLFFRSPKGPVLSFHYKKFRA